MRGWAIVLTVGCASAIGCATSRPAEPVRGPAPVAAPRQEEVATEVVAPDPEPVDEPVKGPFSTDRVREIVRAHFDAMGACYADGLTRDPGLAGTINVRLTIGGDGHVLSATAPKEAAADALTDATVVGCVETEFKGLRFPPTGRGLVSLVYPVVFGVE